MPWCVVSHCIGKLEKSIFRLAIVIGRRCFRRFRSYCRFRNDLLRLAFVNEPPVRCVDWHIIESLNYMKIAAELLHSSHDANDSGALKHAGKKQFHFDSGWFGFWWNFSRCRCSWWWWVNIIQLLCSFDVNFFWFDSDIDVVGRWDACIVAARWRIASTNLSSNFVFGCKYFNDDVR